MLNKKVLIFSLAYTPLEGGAEIAVKEITNRIQGIDFDMVTMRFNKSHPAQEKIGNINVYRINSSKTLFPIEAFLFAKRLHQKNQYDAIWSIMAARAGAAALFFKYNFPRVKYILTLQEGDPIRYMKRRSLYWVNPLFTKIFIKADVIQAISVYLADYAKIMGYRKIVDVIPNGVDVASFHNPNPKLHEPLKTLITTSRLVGKNAVGDIIGALNFLPANVKLQILGSGPLEAELRRKVTNQNLDSRVEFLGNVPNDDIPKYLHNADVFIRPSIAEGFGISFIEAMAAGLPVIATQVGGIVDFIKDGETGLFADVRSPESVAKQVKKLMNDTSLRRKIIENGLKLVKERYEWDLVVKQMEQKVFSAI